MNLPRIPWLDPTLWQTQRYHHLAWFLYGCVEREHLLNLDACTNWWVKALWPAAAARQTTRGVSDRQRPLDRLGYGHVWR